MDGQWRSIDELNPTTMEEAEAILDIKAIHFHDLKNLPDTAFILTYRHGEYTYALSRGGAAFRLVSDAHILTDDE